MPSITCETSALLLVDFQSRLMPVIEGAAAVLDNARRLVDAAQLLGVPLLFTEQNAKGLGPTRAGTAYGCGRYGAQNGIRRLPTQRLS